VTGTMSSLANVKILGGIGSILSLLGLVPGIGTALVVVGWVLVLFAVKEVSDSVHDRAIFNNGVIASVLAIAGSIGLYFLGASIIFGSIGKLFSSNPFGAIDAIFLWLMFLWTSALISSVFLYMSFKRISTKLNVGLFSASAIVYVVGEALTIILVGFVISFIAQILFAISFFSLPEQEVPVSVSSSAHSPFYTSSQTNATPLVTGSSSESTVQVVTERKFCAKCGAKLEAGTNFCAYCGAER
jgi:uncharacterized membrane protein